MHEEVVCRGAAVDAQLFRFLTGVLFHGAQEVRRLEGDRFQSGARDVAGVRSARETDDRAARVRVPVRRPQAGERGHEIDAAGIGDAQREFFHVD